MSNLIVDAKESVVDLEPEDVEPVEPDPDDHGVELSPTKSTRNRVSALDLARAFD